jgi:hypothetical protein
LEAALEYGRTIPVAGGVAIMGIMINQLWPVAVAAGMVLTAAVLIRFVWRRGKDASTP